MVLVGLGGVEAPALMLSTKTTSALVEIRTLPQLPMFRKVLAQSLAERIRLPEGVALVFRLALLGEKSQGESLCKHLESASKRA